MGFLVVDIKVKSLYGLKIAAELHNLLVKMELNFLQNR